MKIYARSRNFFQKSDFFFQVKNRISRNSIFSKNRISFRVNLSGFYHIAIIMTKLAIFKIEEGDFQEGFKVTVSIKGNASQRTRTIIGNLPPNKYETSKQYGVEKHSMIHPQGISESYQRWQADYSNLQNAFCSRARGKSRTVNSQQLLEKSQQSATNFRNAFKTWLSSEDKAFKKFRKALCRAFGDKQTENQIIIQTEDAILKKLPWHEWDLFADVYTKAEIALCTTTFEKPNLVPSTKKTAVVRILAIFGDSKGIDVESDSKSLEKLRKKDAEPIFLSEPKRADISDILWEQNWDIFFFAGHSSSQDEKGKIFINSTESLTIEQLKYGLRKAIEHGLKLAIFNSCDGLKLADDLADLNMPQVIVMREPVPDQVAQLFLKFFLELYSQGESSYLAVRHARERLYENGLDDKYPGACWLPVIYQNPTVKPLSWNDLKFPENPYLGLNAFGEQDAARFFGREKLTEKLWRSFYNLHRAENLPRLLPILGPSGSGKSSVARAGLISALKQRDQSELGKLRFVVIKPEKGPLEVLAKALMQIARLDGIPTHQTRQFIAKMQYRDGLQQIGADLYDSNQQHLVIFIDQFEEIYTYREISHEERNLFIENLMIAVSDHAAHVSVILTLRSDFLGETQHHPDLNQAIAQTAIIVPIMNEEDLRLAISTPAKQANLPLDEATVALLIAQSKEREGVLPLLQFALKEIWKGMRDGVTPAETLNKVGGVGGALAQKAHAIYNKLSDADKSIARRAFLKLVQLGEGSRDTRCRVPVTNMVAKGEVYEQVSAVLHKFSGTDARLLTLSDTNTLAVAEVTHEALLEHWSDLRGWLESSREDLHFAQRLDGAAKRWADVKSEQGKKRAAGLLWQSLNLERLEDFYERNQSDMTTEQSAFFESATKRAHQLKHIRHATIAGLIILTVVSVIGFLSAIEAEKKAVQVEQIRTENLFESQLKHASLLARRGVEDYIAAGVILQQSYHLDNKIAISRRHARDWLARFVDLMGGQTDKLYEGAGAALKSVAVSPDGKLLAAVGEKSTVVLFDVASGKLIKRLEGHDLEADGKEVYIRDVVFHPQGHWLASAGDDKRIIFWSLPSGEKQLEWQAPNRVFALTVSPDGRLLAASTGADDKTAFGNQTTLWAIKTGKILRTFEGHNKVVYESGLTFNPTGELLATASHDHTARLWDVATGKTIRILRGHTDEVTGVSFSPNSQLIATSSADNKIMLWKVDSAQPPRILTGHQDVVHDLHFATKGHRLVSASLDRTLRIWDINSGVTIRVLQGHEAGIGEGGLTIHEEFIFSASWDQTVRRWALDLPHQQMVDLPGEPASTAIAPDGNSVAVGFNDGALRLYSLPETRLLWEQEQVHTGIIKRLAFNPNGSLLASCSSGNTLKLWQVKKRQLQKQQTVHSGSVHAVAFSPDSQLIATAGYDGQIGLFTVGTEHKRFIERAHKGRVASVSFDNSGTRLLSSGMYDFTLRLWNLNTEPPTLLEKEFPTVQHKLMWASFSPDNKRIVRVGRGSSVAIYASEEAQEQYRLIGHQQTVLRAIFSPDNQQVATVSGDATVRLWDLENGNEIFVLHLPANTGKPYQIWDFDFRCSPKNCWIAVPLTRGKLVLYEFGAIRNMHEIKSTTKSDRF